MNMRLILISLKTVVLLFQLSLKYFVSGKFAHAYSTIGMYFASFFFVFYFISISWSLTTGAISVDAKSTVRRADGSVHV